MAVKGRRQEYKELTRAALLDAAARHFVERGFSATTIDDVAAEARVSKGTVYYHFVDKADLFEAVFRDRQTQLAETVAETVARVDSGPWEQIEAGLDAYLEGAVADPAHRALLREAPAALGSERARRIDEEIALPLIEGALDELAAAGEIPDQPRAMLARLLFSALCEAAMTAGADSHPERARRVAAIALKALITGLRRR
jgi:AcrR family transcriptional regulator